MYVWDEGCKIYFMIKKTIPQSPQTQPRTYFSTSQVVWYGYRLTSSLFNMCQAHIYLAWPIQTSILYRHHHWVDDDNFKGFGCQVLENTVTQCEKNLGP